MLEVITNGSQNHAGSKAFGEVCHCLVNVFLQQLFPYGLQDDFQLASHLRLQLKLSVLVHHGISDVIEQWVQIWRDWGPHGQFACSQFCTVSPRLSRHNFDSIRYMSTKLGATEYILSFDNYIKFHTIYVRIDAILTNVTDRYFCVYPVYSLNVTEPCSC